MVWKDITTIGADTIMTKRRTQSRFRFDFEIRGIHVACHMISSDIITKIFMNSNAIHYIKPEQAEI